ncbi:MAG TPA: putative sugar nucleotidyl transferase [Gemmatimonadaceae bacterium]|nr:putative sugar nucleotidyl transferase [Gemmatimonadaceae bacterium]
MTTEAHALEGATTDGGLYLYDDARARRFEPFALTRPVSELRAGVALIRRRWEHILGRSASGFIAGAHLDGFSEPGTPPFTRGDIPAGSILVNARCVPPIAGSGDEAEDVMGQTVTIAGRDYTRVEASPAGGADVWMCRGRVAALRLAQAVPAAALRDGDVSLEVLGARGARMAELRGRWLDEIWSLIVDLVPQLHDDIQAIGPRLQCETPAGAIVVGEHPVYVERGALVEPGVCLDVSAGPVLVRSGAVVRAFTRLVGPCAIARGATVLGDRIHAASIGETTLVRGEVSETVFLGYSNKAHDGFVGHSYVGRWVNLGAGTITSDLKNTYGTISIWTPRGVRDTGTLKLGTFFGDHVKTGIGLRLTTGTVLGAGSSLFGTAMPPKHVPPFSWGEGERLTTFELEKFLDIAARVMGRRNQTLSASQRRQLAAAHALGRRVAR